jgi:hypothetical protein
MVLPVVFFTNWISCLKTHEVVTRLLPFLFRSAQLVRCSIHSPACSRSTPRGTHGPFFSFVLSRLWFSFNFWNVKNLHSLPVALYSCVSWNRLKTNHSTSVLFFLLDQWGPSIKPGCLSFFNKPSLLFCYTIPWFLIFWKIQTSKLFKNCVVTGIWIISNPILLPDYSWISNFDQVNKNRFYNLKFASIIFLE